MCVCVTLLDMLACCICYTYIHTYKYVRVCSSGSTYPCIHTTIVLLTSAEVHINRLYNNRLSVSSIYTSRWLCHEVTRCYRGKMRPGDKPQ